jgi:hypothetical protein
MVRHAAVASQAKVKPDWLRFGHPQVAKNFAWAFWRVFKLWLLPNRPVVVDSLALKEAMMHHAEPEQKKKDHKEGDESDLQRLIQRCFTLGRSR